METLKVLIVKKLINLDYALQSQKMHSQEQSITGTGDKNE